MLTNSLPSFEEIFVRLLELSGDIVGVLMPAGGGDDGEETVTSGGDGE